MNAGKLVIYVSKIIINLPISSLILLLISVKSFPALFTLFGTTRVGATRLFVRFDIDEAFTA